MPLLTALGAAPGCPPRPSSNTPRADYARSPASNPRGPETGTQKVHRGGSWLCSENYCRGYRLAARMMTSPDSGLNNLGFRCAANAE